MKVTLDVTTNFASLGKRLSAAVAAELRGASRQAAEETARHMRSTHRYEDRTGKLSKSCRARLVRMHNRGADYTIEWTAKYAIFVDRGTLPHEITGNPLAFEVDGETVFARRVRHPGTKSYALHDDAEEFCGPLLARLVDEGLARVLGRFA